jgi:hypothetical protein
MMRSERQQENQAGNDNPGYRNRKHKAFECERLRQEYHHE